MLEIIMSIENEEDRSFMETLYNKYSKKMYLTAMDVLNNHHDAEDCVHNTVERMIYSIESFKQAKEKEYLIRLIVVTTKNIAINMYNASKKRNSRTFSTTMYDDEEDSWEIMDIPDFENDVQNIIINEENCQLLRNLINKLDYKLKSVVILMQMGFSYEAISQILGISIEAARKRYSRAKEKLREMGGKALYVQR